MGLTGAGAVGGVCVGAEEAGAARADRRCSRGRAAVGRAGGAGPLALLGFEGSRAAGCRKGKKICVNEGHPLRDPPSLPCMMSGWWQEGHRPPTSFPALLQAGGKSCGFLHASPTRPSSHSDRAQEMLSQAHSDLCIPGSLQAPSPSSLQVPSPPGGQGAVPQPLRMSRAATGS